MTRPGHDTTPETEALRGLIREAHGVMKDLRREMREARELVPLLTDELFAAEVAKRLADLDQQVQTAITEGVARVIRQFDELGDLLLAQDRASRRAGRLSLPELAERRAIEAQDSSARADDR